MGRGSAYPYKHFMLMDCDNWEHHEIENFKEEILNMSDFSDPNKQPDSRDAYYMGFWYDSTNGDGFYIGIDIGGGLPCVFAEPEYDEDEAELYGADHYDSYLEELGDYNAYKERVSAKISELFNSLLDKYPPGTFRTPTSAWTSETLLSYGG